MGKAAGVGTLQALFFGGVHSAYCPSACSGSQSAKRPSCLSLDPFSSKSELFRKQGDMVIRGGGVTQQIGGDMMAS